MEIHDKYKDNDGTIWVVVDIDEVYDVVDLESEAGEEQRASFAYVGRMEPVEDPKAEVEKLNTRVCDLIEENQALRFQLETSKAAHAKYKQASFAANPEFLNNATKVLREENAALRSRLEKAESLIAHVREQLS